MSNSSREQFLLERKKGIGGSDVAAIMGLSSFKTALDVYLDKMTSLIEDEDKKVNENLKRGTRAEKYILEEYAERTGEVLEYNLPMIVDRDYPFMIGHIDAKVKDQKVIIEAKSTKCWPKSWEEKIPQHYLMQIAYYASIFDADRVDVPVLFGGWEYRCFTYWRDAELESRIRTAVVKFWNDHILKSTPPAAQSLEELRQVSLSIDSKKAIEADSGMQKVVKEWREVMAARKILEEREAKLRFNIQEYMGDAGLLEAGRLKVELQSHYTNRLDTNLLKNDYPTIYRNYLRTSETRTLKLIGS